MWPGVVHVTHSRTPCSDPAPLSRTGTWRPRRAGPTVREPLGRDLTPQHPLLCAAHQKQPRDPANPATLPLYPASVAEGYCFAHREGSGRGDPAVQGEGRSEGKAHHRARVSWRAKGQRTQIEAPFAMNEAGTFGAFCLRVCRPPSCLPRRPGNQHATKGCSGPVFVSLHRRLCLPLFVCGHGVPVSSVYLSSLLVSPVSSPLFPMRCICNVRWQRRFHSSKSTSRLGTMLCTSPPWADHRQRLFNAILRLSGEVPCPPPPHPHGASRAHTRALP